MGTCCYCNGKLPVFDKVKLADNNYICFQCYCQAGGELCKKTIKGLNVRSFEERMQIIKEQDIENQKRFQIFSPTKETWKNLKIDEKNKLWCVTGIIFKKVSPNTRIYRYEDIIDFEIIENGTTSVAKGGLKRAAVGGFLFGETGAMVGAATSNREEQSFYDIKIMVNDIKNSVITLNLGSMSYSKDRAYEIYSTLKIMAQDVSNSNEDNNQQKFISSADEIKKYKELLDIGAITLDEYNKKKEQLLNL